MLETLKEPGPPPPGEDIAEMAPTLALVAACVFLWVIALIKSAGIAADFVKVWQDSKLQHFLAGNLTTSPLTPEAFSASAAGNVFVRDYQEPNDKNSIVVTVLIGVGLMLPIVILSGLIITMSLFDWPRRNRRNNEDQGGEAGGDPDIQDPDGLHDGPDERYRPPSEHFFSAFLNGHLRNNRTHGGNLGQRNDDIELDDIGSSPAWPLPAEPVPAHVPTGNPYRISREMHAEAFVMPTSPLPDPFLDSRTRQNSVNSAISQLRLGSDRSSVSTGGLQYSLPSPTITTPKSNRTWKSHGKVRAQVDQIEMARVSSGISTPSSTMTSPYSVTFWGNGSFESGKRPLLPMPDLDVKKASPRTESPITSPESSFGEYTNTKRTEIKRDRSAFPAMNWAIGHERLAKDTNGKNYRSIVDASVGKDREHAGLKKSASINTVTNSSEWQTEYGTECDE